MASVGYGGTSPVVAKGRVYAMGWDRDKDSVFCLNAGTGLVRWVRQYPCPPYGRYHRADEGAYRGPSSTPAYDAATGYLYTLSLDGDLNCWDAGDKGKNLWHLNLYEAYKVPQRPDAGGGAHDYGYTTSPLVYGDSVIAEVGDDQGNLMAFDKRTGQRRWTSQCKDPAGQTGGLVPMTVEGLPCVAVLTLRRLLLARLDAGHEGQTLATYDWQTHYANNIATPAVAGDSVVLTSGYNISKTARIRITLRGAEMVWEQRVYSQVCSPVIYNDHVYMAWGEVRCLDFATGATKWSGGQFGNDGSCLVTGDGRLIVFGNKRIALVETADRSPDAYRELSVKAGVGGSPGWPHVVLAEGKLLVKDASGDIYCFALGG